MLVKVFGVIAVLAMLLWPLALLFWWPVNVVFAVYVGIVGTVVLAGAAMNLLFWEE